MVLLSTLLGPAAGVPAFGQGAQAEAGWQVFRQRRLVLEVLALGLALALLEPWRPQRQGCCSASCRANFRSCGPATRVADGRGLRKPYCRVVVARDVRQE